MKLLGNIGVTQCDWHNNKISEKRKFDYYLLEGQPFAKVSKVNVDKARKFTGVYAIGMACVFSNKHSYIYLFR